MRNIYSFIISIFIFCACNKEVKPSREILFEFNKTTNQNNGNGYFGQRTKIIVYSDSSITKYYEELEHKNWNDNFYIEKKKVSGKYITLNVTSDGVYIVTEKLNGVRYSTWNNYKECIDHYSIDEEKNYYQIKGYFNNEGEFNDLTYSYCDESNLEIDYYN